MKAKKSLFLPIVCGIFWSICTAGLVMLHWFKTKWSTGFQEMLYSLTSPLKGTGNDILNLGLRDCIPPIILLVLLYILLSLLFCSNLFKFPSRMKRWGKHVLFAVSFLLVPATLLIANSALGVTDYFALASTPTTLYEEHYHDPLTAVLTQPDGKRNLIWIVVESLETTYADKASGGKQDSVNYMPELTKLAQDNISFSNSTDLGGFTSPCGTGWTMASLFAQNSGLPYTYPIDANLKNLSMQYAPGVTTVGDILQKQGYDLTFMCGSDATFGGRRSFFEQHGNYRIIDLLEAKHLHYIPSDYYKWWGFEDSVLFDIAKTELNDREDNAPFCLTMLTVDTHHPYGYVCDLCVGGDVSDDNAHTGTVVRCTDHQVTAFVEWCMQQPFYENTTIVITGDHPRMDTGLTEGVSWRDRTVYNVFINSAKEPSGEMTNRQWMTMDMMPTLLSAIGFEWNSHRLALGTDLFSGEPTLCETMGWDTLNTELGKASAFYVSHFAN